MPTLLSSSNNSLFPCMYKTTMFYFVKLNQGKSHQTLLLAALVILLFPELQPKPSAQTSHVMQPVWLLCSALLEWPRCSLVEASTSPVWRRQIWAVTHQEEPELTAHPSCIPGCCPPSSTKFCPPLLPHHLPRAALSPETLMGQPWVHGAYQNVSFSVSGFVVLEHCE